MSKAEAASIYQSEEEARIREEIAMAKAQEAAKIKADLDAIESRLGFLLSEEFITDTLGVQSAGIDKRSVLFYERDWKRICDVLCAHVSACAVNWTE